MNNSCGLAADCTYAEREFIEAWLAGEKNGWADKDYSRWIAASGHLRRERAPKKWRVHSAHKHMAVGPNGEERIFYKQGGNPDNATCANEIVRLNKELEGR